MKRTKSLFLWITASAFLFSCGENITSPSQTTTDQTTPIIESNSQTTNQTTPKSEDTTTDNTTIDDSTVEDSTIEDSSIEDSTIENFSVDDSTVDSGETSSIENSTIEDSSIEDSTVDSEEETSGEESTVISYDSIQETEEDDFEMTTKDGTFYTFGARYVVTTAGTYSLKGTLHGQILVDASDDDDVVLELNGTTIIYDQNSPIYILNANGVDISAKNGTENTVTDLRETKVEDEEGMGEGAIYSKCDLKLKGKGKLTVTGNHNNGIHSSDDLEIKNLNVSTTAIKNAYKGNDSLTIESGTIQAISTSGDGFKTENTDISSKGNQRGNITISGGEITSYTAFDAFDAAYNLSVTGGKINAYTNKYAAPVIDVSNIVSSSSLYLRVPQGAYDSAYRYSFYLYNTDETYSWSDATYETSGRSSRNTYYYYKINRPTSYTNFKIYRFENAKNNSTEDYNAVSTGKTFSDDFDMISINSIRNGSISLGSWSNYETSGGGGGQWGQQEGNKDKSNDSAKGLKADNKIEISDGEIHIESYDDAIHANYGDAFDNGETGIGDVLISGGTLELNASDDGIHADRYLTITGGDIHITHAYEGIEGNIIQIQDGNIKVNASDDGINAANKAGLTPEIHVDGGLVDVTVGTGDVDGIDSNGSYAQTGGVVITRGAPNSTNRMSTGLDCDRGATLTGGTLIIVGILETKPTLTNAKTCTFSSNTFVADNYNLSVGEISFVLENSYKSYVNVYSSLFTSGSTYSLSNSSSTYTAEAK